MLSHTMKRAWHLMVLFCFLFLLSFPLHANAMSVPRVCVVDTRRSSDAASLMSSIRKNGGTPVLVTTKKKIRAASYDGLALPGGGDVNPALYHEKNRGSRNVSSARDSLQLYAISQFVRARKPILGVCRGLQLLNVYFGGTLYQNIGRSHRMKQMKVSVTPASALYHTLGPTATLLHAHHQAIKRLGNGLIATQFSTDKKRCIEAIQHETLPIYAFQYHPEHGSKKGAGKKIIRWFIAQCR